MQIIYALGCSCSSTRPQQHQQAGIDDALRSHHSHHHHTIVSKTTKMLLALKHQRHNILSPQRQHHPSNVDGTLLHRWTKRARFLYILHDQMLKN